MKIILCLIFFFSNDVSAQFVRRTETPFNRFVKKQDIEWACYADDTLKTSSPDLRKMLIEKMKARKIKPVENMLSGTAEELKLKYKIPEFVAPEKEAEPEGLLNVYQILYVKKGKLYAYISRVSPLIDITTSGGTYLGRGEYFTAAINKRPLRKFRLKRNMIFLKQTSKQFFTDSISERDRLKEVFNQNLTETLWPYLLSGKLEVFSVLTGGKSDPRDISAGNIPGIPLLTIPVYDSLGSIVDSRKISSETNASHFRKIKLTQRWYYSHKKNAVYCTISDAELYYTTGPEEPMPLLRIVF